MFTTNFLIVTRTEKNYTEAGKVQYMSRTSSTHGCNDHIGTLYSECLKKQLESKVLRPIRGYLH